MCELLSCHLSGGRVGVVEGVMGFYDGIGSTDEASAAHVARASQTPVVLVVRPKGQALSLAAMISGFTQFAENTIRGVILNGVTAGNGIRFTASYKRQVCGCMDTCRLFRRASRAAFGTGACGRTAKSTQTA